MVVIIAMFSNCNGIIEEYIGWIIHNWSLLWLNLFISFRIDWTLQQIQVIVTKKLVNWKPHEFIKKKIQFCLQWVIEICDKLLLFNLFCLDSEKLSALELKPKFVRVFLLFYLLRFFRQICIIKRMYVCYDRNHILQWYG